MKTTIAVALAAVLAAFATLGCHAREESALVVSACEAGACPSEQTCNFDPLTGAAICVHECGPSEAGVVLYDASSCPEGTLCWAPSSVGVCVQTCTKNEDCAHAPSGFFADCVLSIGPDGDAGTFAVCHYVPSARDAEPTDSPTDSQAPDTTPIDIDSGKPDSGTDTHAATDTRAAG